MQKTYLLDHEHSFNQIDDAYTNGAINCLRNN